MSITKKYIINGPFNIVRITNKNKILYIMGDYHKLLNEQTECPYNDDIESLDIDKFLLLFMKNNKNKEIDLFMESKNTEFINTKSNKKQIYIQAVQKLFQHYIVKNKKDVMINSSYKNFRFHFSDIRNQILNYYDIFWFFDNNIKDKNINNLNVPFLYNYLKNMINENIKSLTDNLIINKILNNYSNDEIKIKINNIYNEYVLNNLDYLLLKINQLIQDYSQLTEALIMRELYIIDYLCKEIYLCITDLFFIRRFLDKNYIKNSILYTGDAHLTNIMYLLVKYFNFEITHIYNFTNVKKINKFILNYKLKNLSHIYDITNLLEINYSNIIQCSNLFDFPDNFD